VPDASYRAVLRSLGRFTRALTAFEGGLDIASPILLHFLHESATSARFQRADARAA